MKNVKLNPIVLPIVIGVVAEIILSVASCMFGASTGAFLSGNGGNLLGWFILLFHLPGILLFSAVPILIPLTGAVQFSICAWIVIWIYKRVYKGADVSVKNNDNVTSLMLASQEGRLDVVQALLAKSADVNAKTNKGVTALMLASENGYLDVVQILLSKGADVNAEDKDGKTALSLAKRKGNSYIAQPLIKAGAKE